MIKNILVVDVMHETLIERMKFNLDQFTRVAENTYILEGWVFSETKAIEAIRIETSSDLRHEVDRFTIRQDVNTFYKLPETVRTGFKQVLTIEPEDDFDFLIFRVKFHNDDRYQAFSVIDNTEKDEVAPEEQLTLTKVGINNQFPSVVVVDNYYEDPDAIREYALQQEFVYHSTDHKGKRTNEQFLFDGVKESFESILQRRITNWETHLYNGVFQYCVAEDPLVYHSDPQTYAAMIFLSPDAPAETGTSFYKSRHNDLIRAPTEEDCERLGQTREEVVADMYAGNFYDKTRWELIDVVANMYNRLIFFDAKRVHSASEYFGDSLENGRLFQIFFFDTEAL